MQTVKINSNHYAEKGIGSMLSALFKRPAPKMEDLLNGKESFEEIMGDIKDAKIRQRIYVINLIAFN